MDQAEAQTRARALQESARGHKRAAAAHRRAARKDMGDLARLREACQALGIRLELA